MKTETAQHSPIPWQWMREDDDYNMIPCEPFWQSENYSGNKYICDANGNRIVGVGEYDVMNGDNHAENAAFIVRATNHYELMLNLLREVYKSQGVTNGNSEISAKIEKAFDSMGEVL